MLQNLNKYSNIIWIRSVDGSQFVGEIRLTWTQKDVVLGFLFTTSAAWSIIFQVPTGIQCYTQLWVRALSRHSWREADSLPANAMAGRLEKNMSIVTMNTQTLTLTGRTGRTNPDYVFGKLPGNKQHHRLYGVHEGIVNCNKHNSKDVERGIDHSRRSIDTLNGYLE